MKTRLPVHVHALAVVLFAAISINVQSQIVLSRRVNPPPPLAPLFGDPLPNLTLEQLAEFADGRDDFEQVETVASGLGPIFNNVSCAACHSAPIVGGSSRIVVTRFGRMVNGRFDPLTEKGGTLLHQFAIAPAVREVIPREANVIAHRRTPPLFGVGLIEAIPDDAIRQNALLAKPAGVKGKVSTITDVATGQSRVGRFGWKAQHATLLSFAADAYLNEIGITSRFFPHDVAPNGNTNLLHLFDTVADPEDQPDPATGKSDVDRAADFMRLLGPPPALPLTASAQAGQTLFSQTGCAACHKPSFMTGRSPTASLNNKPVPLYSDLLLHDMGSLGDGIAQSAAGTHEMKTPPLWGLRANPSYLHDGRAHTVDEAIRAHDGEATSARDHYSHLTPQQRQQLLDFLHSL
ncbi:MAG: c-type cytochrome [Verrucomicrobia bacterium]|nr:c-type cytochrome [Verrucomicrobiota bacterium]